MNKRIDYIDAVKGLAILCIALLHFEAGVLPNGVNVWIGLFMITAFFFTSGWLQGIKGNSLSVKEVAKKRIRQLGFPYFWFTLFILVFDAIWFLLGQIELKIIFRDIYKSIVLHGIGTLWFLPVLFFAECLFCLLHNSKRPVTYSILLLVCSIFLIHLYDTYWIPLRTDNIHRIIDAPLCPIVWTLRAWPVIAAGFLLAKYFSRYIESTNLWTFIGGLAMLTISIILVIHPIPIDIVNAYLINLLSAFSMMCLFSNISKLHATKFFTYWGKNSLVLMCTHFSITLEIMKFIDRVLLHHPQFEGIRTLAYFVAAIIITYPMVWLFNNKLSFMLGKRNQATFS